MLALEPRALISTSLEVNPGPPETSGSDSGQLDLAPFVSQLISRDGLRKIASTGATLPAGSWLYEIDRGYGTQALVDGKFGGPFSAELKAVHLLQDAPSDPTKYQIMRKLRIIYPATTKDPTRVAGTGRLPLVVLVMGNHRYDRPSHEGYTYLQKELAAHGMVSVSVDTNLANVLDLWIETRAEIVLGVLDDLRAEDKKTSSRFYQRLDFSNVGLMGHSRGGDAVVRAAILNAARTETIADPLSTKPRYEVKAVCSLAPTDMTGAAAPSLRYSLSKSATPFYAVVYGGLDGDVWGGAALDPTGTGFRHYDRATTDKAMVFLDTYIHNRFNDVWADDGDDGGLDPADLARVPSRADHRAVAKEYIGGLFRWKLLGVAGAESLFDGTTANSVGTFASVQWSFGTGTVLDDMENATSANMGTRNPAGVTVKEISANATVKDHTNHETGVLDLADTTTSVEAYKLELPGPQDWSGFDQFTFRVCADADISSADDLATQTAKLAASALPDFTLRFSDAAGGSVDVTPASLRPLRRPVPHIVLLRDNYGSLLLDTSGRPRRQSCTVIHLETLAVDLHSLSGVDRTRMTAFAVLLPAFPRHQFFDSFQLVKR